MHYYVPLAPLSRFVELFWLADGRCPPHARERVLPTGAMQLIVNLAEDEIRVYEPGEPHRVRRFPGSLVTGAHSSFGVVDTASQASTLGVAFRPGGAFPFLGLSARDLRDVDAPLDALWGVHSEALRDELLGHGTPAARFRILESALLARAARPLERHPAVALALAAFRSGPESVTVAQVVERAGLSHRRFVELFTDEVGLPPKLFRRVRRFQAALHRLERGQGVELTDLALACGYYDQAHMARDFRAFAGLAPTAYLALRPEQRNHVPLLA